MQPTGRSQGAGRHGFAPPDLPGIATHVDTADLRSAAPSGTSAHLADLRSEYALHAGRSIALPAAGALMWAVVGTVALFLPDRTSTIVLLFGTGAIFPVALALARPLGERLLDNPSPLAGLMGRSVLMVNLLWAVHLTLYARAPEVLPLTLGIGLGLHWVVFGWVIGRSVGLVHAVVRTLLVVAAWWLLPGEPISAVAAAVVVAYACSIVSLLARPKSGGAVHSPTDG